MYQFNSDVAARLDVAAALVNAESTGFDPAGRDRIFTDHGYSAPVSERDWEALSRTAHSIDALFSLVTSGDHRGAVARLNDHLAKHRVTMQLEQHGERHQLHFHTPEATFADGWTAGITAALAITYGAGEAARIGRCEASACTNFFVDRGRNRQRRFCCLRCQNRSKSADYRERVAQRCRTMESHNDPAQLGQARSSLQ
jgi:hypothetical protein